MKTLPAAYYACPDLAAFARDVDAASFRRLWRRQFRRLRRIIVRQGDGVNARGLRLMRHALFAFYSDCRHVALEAPGA